MTTAPFYVFVNLFLKANIKKFSFLYPANYIKFLKIKIKKMKTPLMIVSSFLLVEVFLLDIDQGFFHIPKVNKYQINIS